MNILTWILILNGIYDIACAACILFVKNDYTQLSSLHPGMFKTKGDDPMLKRLLAYWILTYGFVRLVAGIHYSVSSDTIAAMTYFVEAFCFEYESRVGQTMHQNKVTFVSFVSVALGMWVLLRIFIFTEILNNNNLLL